MASRNGKMNLNVAIHLKNRNRRFEESEKKEMLEERTESIRGKRKTHKL